MKRADWLDRLWETIEAHRALPFCWAGRGDSHDCCTFAAACIEAMTGSSHLDELLCNYDDEASAQAYIRESGGLARAISTYLGEEKPLAFLGRGDVAIVTERDREIVGICIGHEVICAGLNGLIRLPRRAAIAAWSL